MVIMYIIPNFQDFFETKMITYNIEGGGFSNLNALCHTYNMK